MRGGLWKRNSTLPGQDGNEASPLEPVSGSAELQDQKALQGPIKSVHDELTPVAPQVKAPGLLRGARIPIVVGIDFGTSSTKVTFRRLGDTRSWVLPAVQSCKRLPWFCTSTTYQLRKGHVRFGAQSTNPTQSLKLDLLNSESPKGTFGAPERRAAAYLGFIIESVKPMIEEHFAVDSFSPRFSVGLPMAYLESSTVDALRQERYADVARAAVATTTLGGGPGIEQAMPEDELNLILNESIERSSAINTVTILPESIAALVSLSKDPSIESRSYTVVDIGAGTTDVSTSAFRLYGSGQHKLACYDDSTQAHGAYELEQALQAGGDGGLTLDRIWGQWAKSWMQAKQKDLRNRHSHHRWCDTTVMFTGGGGSHPKVQTYFIEQRKQFCPVLQTFQNGTHFERHIYRPKKQVLGSCGAPTDTREAFHMLAVAHGLSFMKREWPEFFEPDEVEDAPRV